MEDVQQSARMAVETLPSARPPSGNASQIGALPQQDPSSATRRAACAGLAVMLAAWTAGCAGSPRTGLLARPSSDGGADVLPDLDDVRIFGDAPLAALAGNGFEPLSGRGGRMSVLALSGGGSGGAFGAGLLNGWTRSGQRPAFDVVTGVSAGALLAPYAFLGSRHDAALERLFASGFAERLDRRRPLLAALIDNGGFLDPEPLRRVIAQEVTPDLLAAIAAEHRRGRRLFTVTTNLDAQRPTVWDMGRIAARGPAGLALFRDVTLASSSIPAVMPPVLIAGNSSGRQVEEMHVDGGATAMVFTAPEALLAGGRIDRGALRDLSLHVIVNLSLDPEFEAADIGPVAVARRSYEAFVKTHVRNALNAAHAFTQRVGGRFRMAAIRNDDAVAFDPSDPFATRYMRALYEQGFRRGLLGERGFDTQPPVGRDQPTRRG
jgi:hypothetical protein